MAAIAPVNGNGNGNAIAKKIVCAIGAVGSMWLVKCLLEKGYTVHIIARDPENKAKASHLLSLPGADERLKLFGEELSEDDSFDAAIAGSDRAFHVATPTEFAPKDPQKDLIEPANDWTVNVLGNVLNVCSTSTDGTIKVLKVCSKVTDGTVKLLTKSSTAIDETVNVLTAWGTAIDRTVDFLTAFSVAIDGTVNVLKTCSKRYPQYNVPNKIEDVSLGLKMCLPSRGVNISSKRLVERGFNFNMGSFE